MSLQNFEPLARRSLWRENGGNLLAFLVALILLTGAAVLTYRQYRFVPPSFPPERSIKRPAAETELGEYGAMEGEDQGLRIRVTGASNDSGAMRIALYATTETFNDPERSIGAVSVEIIDQIAIWRIPTDGLPKRIAVAAFHDENADGRLNRSGLGVPTERYGFSNNARGLIGPPRFEEAAVEGPFRGQTLEIVIR